jgi:AsmA-like C-terminal region
MKLIQAAVLYLRGDLMAAITRPFRILLIFLAVVLVLFAAAGFLLRDRLRHADEYTRTWIIRELSQRFDSPVELDSLHVQVWPLMGVKGQGLTVHYHNRTDVPPMIRIGEFTFNAGLMGLFRPVKHISSVTISNMVLTFPPSDKSEKTPTPAASPARKPAPTIIVDKIFCDDTELFFLSRKPGKDPLDFELHNLVLTSVGAGKPFDFRANLTNAKPVGEIASVGKFGPWDSDHPGNSPVSGSYQFSHADLYPLAGIGGILSSTGKYNGPLDDLAVDGQTDTPDFSIDPVGRGVPLHTDFSATVNGTDGDTFLHPVRATLGKSLIIANGSVVLIRAKQGHQINLDVTAPAARLEDLLALAMKSKQPPMTGTLKLNTKLSIPPSKEKVIDKLTLDGDFDSEDARFTSPEMRNKLRSLSRHAMGEPTNLDAGSAISDLKGHFHLENAVFTFTHLNFSVEGAAILLDGTYNIHGGELDLHGDLRLNATLSQTLTGWKSALAKPFDPLFKKDGAGAVIPLAITGTRENPVFAVSVFHKTFKTQMNAAKPQQ